MSRQIAFHLGEWCLRACHWGQRTQQRPCPDRSRVSAFNAVRTSPYLALSW